MPYELIRHTLGKDSVCKLQFFRLEKNYPGVVKEYLKNLSLIFSKVVETEIE